MDLGMIQFLFQKEKEKLLEKWTPKKNIRLITDIKLLKKLENFCKILIINTIKIKLMSNYIFIYFKNSNFTFKFIFLIKNFFIQNKIITIN